MNEIKMLNEHLRRLEAEIKRLRAMIPGAVLLTSTYKDRQGNKLDYRQGSRVKQWIINRICKWMTGV